MATAYDLPINLTNSTRQDSSHPDNHNLVALLLQHAAAGIFNVFDYGASPTPGFDNYPAFAAARDVAQAAKGVVWVPEGTYEFASGESLTTQRRILSSGAGVSWIGAGSDVCKIKLALPNLVSWLYVHSSLNASASAAEGLQSFTINTNFAVGATTFTGTFGADCDIEVGDRVFYRFGQNSVADVIEPREWGFAKVVAVTATTVELDVPARYAVTIAGITNSYNLRILKLDSDDWVQGVTISGFGFVSDGVTTNFEHAIHMLYTQGVILDDLYGENVGTGILCAQFCEDIRIGTYTVPTCVNQLSANKGRAMTISSCRNVSGDVITARDCYGPILFLEYRNENITFKTVHVSLPSGRDADKSVIAVADFSGDVHIDTLLIEGDGTDQLVFEGQGSNPDRQVTIINLRCKTTPMMKDIPLAHVLGNFTILEDDGLIRNYRMWDAKWYEREVRLEDGIDVTTLFPAGYAIERDVYVSPNVDDTQLTFLRWARADNPTSLGTVAWTAGEQITAYFDVGTRGAGGTSGNVMPTKAAHYLNVRVTTAVDSAFVGNERVIVHIKMVQPAYYEVDLSSAYERMKLSTTYEGAALQSLSHAGRPAPSGNWPLASAGAVDLVDYVHGNNLTNVNAVVRGAGPSSIIPDAAEFNGTNQYFTVNDQTVFDPSRGFTVAVWASVDDISANRCICGQFLSTGNQRSWRIVVVNAVTDLWRATISADGSATVVNIDGPSAHQPVISTYYRVVLVYDGSGLATLYVNGAAGTPVAVAAVFNSTAPITIGANFGGGVPGELWDGRESSFVVAQKVWTLADVKWDYNGGQGRDWLT